MNAKMQSCFKPHAMMHSLFGLGLGLLLAILFPALQVVWLALAIVVVAVVLDVMRKETV